MKIYTRNGDSGKTSLFGGKKVSKNDLRIEVLGEIDELNSAIGVAIAEISNIKYQISNMKEELIKVQKDLFQMGSSFNMKYKIPFDHSQGRQDTKCLDKRVSEFEKMIDDLSRNLPEIHNFILPGGGELGSFLHFVRAVCRRTERRIAALSKKHPPLARQEKINPQILKYFNRLSDLLFTMARFVNQKENKKEIIWKNK